MHDRVPFSHQHRCLVPVLGWRAQLEIPNILMSIESTPKDLDAKHLRNICTCPQGNQICHHSHVHDLPELLRKLNMTTTSTRHITTQTPAWLHQRFSYPTALSCACTALSLSQVLRFFGCVELVPVHLRKICWDLY